jgi:hypothetical protein
MCAIYIPPDKNVFYRKYEYDIFDVLQEEIELYSVDISFSHTDLRNSPSANFLIIPFEIFQEHTLRTLFTLPFSLISLSAEHYMFQ